MRFSFRRISALATSAMMVGMTMGMAAAANYPNPFVVGGTADVAIVYGTGSGVSALDLVQAGNIQSNLQSFMGSGSGGTTTSTSGETRSLDTENTRIYLNTSLNTARASLTKTDLPTVLGESTFSGDVDAKLTQQIDFFAGNAAGGDNSGRVIFAKQPKSSNDPVIGISLATGVGAAQLYNVSATMKAVNFTHADSEGETITLFGRDYVVSTATDDTDLVLFSSAEEITLTKTGSESPSATVNIAGSDHTVTLLNGDSTSATVQIDSESKDIVEGKSKKVAGIDVAVKSVTSSDVAGITATLLVGSEKITLTHGATVTKGSDDDPVDGTTAYLTGTAGTRTHDTTAITVAVYRPDSSNDAILIGDSFPDPVWESFKLDFAGLNVPLDDATRDIIEVTNSGDDSMTVAFTDVDGNAFNLDFAHNESSQWGLADDSNNTIYVLEMSNATEDEYVVLGNEDYGHVLQITDLFNSSGGDHTKHRAKFQDVGSGETFETTFTSDTQGTVIIDGKTYTVAFNSASGGTHKVQLKFPTSDSNAGTGVVAYPTVETQRGAKVSLYEPLTLNLTGLNGTKNAAWTLHLPDGDGYTDVALTYLAGGVGGAAAVWGVGSGHLNISTDAGQSNYTTFTVGRLTYNLTTNLDGGSDAAGAENLTYLFLTDPEAGSTTKIVNPGLVIFEEQDDKNNYEAIVVDLEDDPKGTSDDGVGVSDILFSTVYGHYAATRSSDSDFTEDIDFFGTFTTKDASDSDQTTATISYPDVQMYAQLFVGEEGSTATGGVSGGGSASLGDVLVKDSEVSSVSSKNLVVVGGSCINSAAANLVGGAHCGSSWTDSTGAGSGQFVIQSFGDAYSTGKIALLVAGYEAADTVNAATFLRTQTVDTAAGKKYVGTSATSAELQVA